MLPVLGKKAVLEWCMEEGLIRSSYVCRNVEKVWERKKGIPIGWNSKQFFIPGNFLSSLARNCSKAVAMATE
ncbi:hypothetical protein TNCV_3346071 [Trichonephila clavipes]|nr:hypothetical protein TNCV_3346071 [Trichonephila clavipes]